MSRALTHLVYRNTVVEDLHAEGVCLDDETMKIINKEVNNRIYTQIIFNMKNVSMLELPLLSVEEAIREYENEIINEE